MRIEITRAFNDLEAKDPDDRRREIGDQMTVTSERGAQLIPRFAKAIDVPTDPAKSGGK